MRVVYVKEYQPAQVSARIGGDPIYRAASRADTLRVSGPVAAGLIVGVGVVSGLILIALSLST